MADTRLGVPTRLAWRGQRGTDPWLWAQIPERNAPAPV